ncbi:RraA family protein [Shouchella patagoniensis]|uniref:RraA family protein n=1 Tax=Shouchella patagoniensis TaxID=228576 RepID=UPI000994AD74|nr:hypothetical protein [Shouchella patagoniensis]
MESYVTELGQLTTSAISDALDVLGYNGGIKNFRIYSCDKRIIGPVFTVEFADSSEPAKAADYIEEVDPGTVVMITNNNREDCTVWGDLLSLYAKNKGITGTIVYGCFRDIEEIKNIDYPIYSTGLYMKSGKNRVKLKSIQEPIVIEGTKINPDDFVVVDTSGLLHIPKELIDKVIPLAQEIEVVENRIRIDIASGKEIRDSRETHDYNQFALRM